MAQAKNKCRSLASLVMTKTLKGIQRSKHLGKRTVGGRQLHLTASNPHSLPGTSEDSPAADTLVTVNRESLPAFGSGAFSRFRKVPE
jgi:hypothetical protein